MDLNNLFGDKNWNDVRSCVTARVRRRWSRMGTADIEDAVSDGIEDLLMSWLELPSSITDDPVRNFNYAVRHASWRAMRVLGRVADYQFHHTTINDYATPDVALPSTPEEDYIEAEDVQRVRDAIAATPTSERRRWLDPLLAGKSTREAAAEQGVSAQTVSNHRRAGVAELAKAVA